MSKIDNIKNKIKKSRTNFNLTVPVFGLELDKQIEILNINTFDKLKKKLKNNKFYNDLIIGIFIKYNKDNIDNLDFFINYYQKYTKNKNIKDKLIDFMNSDEFFFLDYINA